jgi:hypothetical protein
MHIKAKEVDSCFVILPDVDLLFFCAHPILRGSSA